MVNLVHLNERVNTKSCCHFNSFIEDIDLIIKADYLLSKSKVKKKIFTFTL